MMQWVPTAVGNNAQRLQVAEQPQGCGEGPRDQVGAHGPAGQHRRSVSLEAHQGSKCALGHTYSVCRLVSMARSVGRVPVNPLPPSSLRAARGAQLPVGQQRPEAHLGALRARTGGDRMMGRANSLGTASSPRCLARGHARHSAAAERRPSPSARVCIWRPSVDPLCAGRDGVSGERWCLPRPRSFALDGSSRDQATRLNGIRSSLIYDNITVYRPILQQVSK